MPVFSDEPNNYNNICSFFATLLECSILDLDLFIQIVIDVLTIRDNELDQIEYSISSPKRNRTIAELGADCYHNTIFSEGELVQLLDLFFGSFPNTSFHYKRVRFTYEEVLIIGLHYMSHGTLYFQMKNVYGGDWTRYCYIVQWFSKFIYHKFYHRLCGR